MGRSRVCARAIIFLTLLLVIPLIAGMNSVDPTWIPGLYDDADGDLLITQAMSPESMIGLAALLVVCLAARAYPLSGVAPACHIPLSREPVPRGPPAVGPPTTVLVVDRFVLPVVGLLHLNPATGRVRVPPEGAGRPRYDFGRE